MIVATWNVNGIRARAARLTEWLRERKPDIVCLQELKIRDEEFPFLEIRAAGYHATIVGQVSWNGVGVLSREEASPVVRELPGASEAGARFLVTRVGAIEVASVYVPNGKTLEHADYMLKLRWLEQLALYVESRHASAPPLLVGGDFNVCATDADSYGGASLRGTIFHTDAERVLLTRIGQAGLVDLYRSRHAEAAGFSWWDYRAGRFHKNEGLRIDLLFASAGLAERVRDVFVDRDFRKKSKEGAVPSDHAPVVAELD